MKYCLSAKQPDEYLRQADEIIIDWDDRKYLFDFIDKYQGKRFVLICEDYSLSNDEWHTLEQYNDFCNNNLQLCITQDPLLNEAREHGIKFFYGNTIGSYYSLNALIEYGVCAARVTGILAHDLNYLKSLPIEIRVFANSSGNWLNYKPIVGTWFRPEDLYQIDAIDVCEFYYRDIKEQQALYDIYAKNHEWPGRLYLIIKEIHDTTISNRMIPPSFQQRRNNCKMKCQTGGACNFCDIAIHLANPDLLRPIKEQLKNVQSNTANDAETII